MVTIAFFIDDAVQSRGTTVSGLIVAITIAAIPIYNIDQWSLFKRSLVHFLVMALTVLPLLLYSEWFAPLVAIAVFIAFGVVGWTIGYVIHRTQGKHST